MGGCFVHRDWLANIRSCRFNNVPGWQFVGGVDFWLVDVADLFSYFYYFPYM